jgi:steroid delta-isomerase-like uncharacterized protein
MNLDFATSWANALSTDVDELVSLYADELVIDIGTYADSVGEAIITQDDLRRKLAPFSNTDPGNGQGIHVFEATNYEGHERHGIIQWTWSAESLATFRGIPAGGRRLTTVGQTFQQYDEDGKIVRETTYWADLHPLKTLGVV